MNERMAGSPFTYEQFKAREKAWRAAVNGTGLRLNADEAKALWRSILIDQFGAVEAEDD